MEKAISLAKARTESCCTVWKSTHSEIVLQRVEVNMLKEKSEHFGDKRKVFVKQKAK
jgi:hypothetical protein